MIVIRKRKGADPSIGPVLVLSVSALSARRKGPPPGGRRRRSHEAAAKSEGAHAAYGPFEGPEYRGPLRRGSTRAAGAPLTAAARLQLIRMRRRTLPR